MADLSALSSVTTTAAGLSNIILVTPLTQVGYQPKTSPSINGTNPVQPPTLLFHYEGEQSVTLTSDVTDHYIEDNTTLQDQIALKPEIVTTHGFIGELNNVIPGSNTLLKQLADKLTNLSAYNPSLTINALTQFNNAYQAYQAGLSVANSLVTSWSSINNSGSNVIGSEGLGSSFDPVTGKVEGPQNLQQRYFQQFYGYWKLRTLFKVQTPWAIFDNMVIQSLRAIQDAETRMITDFELNFKMIRTASTTSTTLGPNVQGQLAAQSALLQNFGVSSGVPSLSVSSAYLGI